MRFAGEANATVRLCVEPSQGLQAAAEVGEVDAQTRKYFQLCAGEDGIEEGEEVTISYGNWPNDVFFLFFGFCPDANANDSVVLFQVCVRRGVEPSALIQREHACEQHRACDPRGVCISGRPSLS
jgi:hypothetical protein